MFVKLKEVVLSGYRVVKVNLFKFSYNQVKGHHIFFFFLTNLQLGMD